MRRIRIIHTTRYGYAEPVTLLQHKLLIRPREGHDVRIESSRLEISPAYEILWQRDIYGNSVAVVEFKEPSSLLEITSDVVIQHYEEQPLDFVVAPYARVFPFHYDPAEQMDLMPYQIALFPQDSETMRDWLSPHCSPGTGMPTDELLERINSAIVEGIEYRMREEPGVQSPARTLTLGQGSCRDVATLFIEACRYCGLAARFVSGYLVSSAAVEDFRSTHAWAEIYLPGAGWRGFDSTSGQLVAGEHIAVAVARHPEAIPPVSGSFIGHLQAAPVMNVDVTAALL